MAALTADILENHGFMANVIKVGAGGPSVSSWIGRVVSAVGGFVGDIRLAEDAGPVRVAVALDRDARRAGENLDPLVLSALNRLLAGMADRSAARELRSLVAALREIWRAEPAFECSVDGFGLSLDFVRARHRVDFGPLPGVLYVHGRTIVGRGFDPVSPLVEIAPDGSCRLADGSVAHAGTLARSDHEVEPEELVEIAEDAAAGGLTARILRARAGSVSGPAPGGCLVSRGEDGGVLVVAAMEATVAPLALRLLPASLQVVSGGAVVFQSECRAAAEIAGWTAGRRVSVVCLHDAAAEVASASVEIRTAA